MSSREAIEPSSMLLRGTAAEHATLLLACVEGGYKPLCVRCRLEIARRAPEQPRRLVRDVTREAEGAQQTEEAERDSIVREAEIIGI